MITWLPNDVHDNKICPQGLKRESFDVPVTRTGLEEDNAVNVPLPLEPEQAGILEEQTVLEEDEDMGFLQLNDEDDEEEVGEDIDV